MIPPFMRMSMTYLWNERRQSVVTYHRGRGSVLNILSRLSSMVTGALSALLQSGFEVDSSLMNVHCAFVFVCFLKFSLKIPNYSSIGFGSF